jgi:Secretion system C-terminal sorting domain
MKTTLTLFFLAAFNFVQAQAPTASAPTPPSRTSTDVKSIFSEAYTPVCTMGYTGSDNTFDNSWCAATTTLLQVATNNTNVTTGLGCEGITFLDGRFNATAFTHMHIDIFTNTPTLAKSFNIKFSNWNGTAAEANALAYSATNANILPATNPNSWISIDLPFTSFTPINGSSRNDLVQFVITSDLGTVYYDNLYVYKNTPLNTNDVAPNQYSIYPNPCKNTISITAPKTVQKLAISDVLGHAIITIEGVNAQKEIDISNLTPGIYFAKIYGDGAAQMLRFIKE